VLSTKPKLLGTLRGIIVPPPLPAFYHTEVINANATGAMGNHGLIVLFQYTSPKWSSRSRVPSQRPCADAGWQRQSRKTCRRHPEGL